MFYFVFRIPEIFEKAQKTIAFILVETDPSVRLVSPGRRHLRAVELPGAVVLQNQKQPRFGRGNMSQISAKEQKFSFSPSSTCSDIISIMSRIEVCLFNIPI